MSVVKINVLTVPAEMRETLEKRFAARAGVVSSEDGFEWFELLRPTGGTDQYFVYTRWRSEEDFERWVNSKAFTQGHAKRITIQLSIIDQLPGAAALAWSAISRQLLHHSNPDPEPDASL